MIFLGFSNNHQDNHGALDIPGTRRHSFLQYIKVLHLKGSLSAMSEAMQYMSCKLLTSLIVEEIMHRSKDPQGLYWTECFESLVNGVQLVKKVVINSSCNFSVSSALLTPIYQFHNLEVLEIKEWSIDFIRNRFFRPHLGISQARETLPAFYMEQFLPTHISALATSPSCRRRCKKFVSA